MYSAGSGQRQSVSESAIDNVEQVRATGAGGVIYKVSAGGVDTLAGEPFALAATRPLTPLTTPQPRVALDTNATAPVGPTDEVSVTATVSNPSPDLAAPDADVTLTVPAGAELVGGSQTQGLGTLSTHGAAGSTATATWVVRGTTDGLKRLTATATASVYGSTLTGTRETTFAVDAAGPRLTLAAPSGTTTAPTVALAWRGSDPAGVSAYDVEVSLNGAPWARWLASTTNTTATYRGTPGNTYRFRVRARDTLGNASAYLTSSPVAIAPPTKPSPQPPILRPAGIALTSTRRTPRTLTLAGRLHPDATGRVTARWWARRRPRRFVARATSAVRAGAFKTRLTIPRRARRIKRSTLALIYSGDAAFRAERLRVTMRTR